MTLIEAISSGRRFKRRGRVNWMEVSNTGFIVVEDVNYLEHTGPKQQPPMWTKADIIAADYELDEPRTTVSYSEFERAWKEVFGSVKDVETGKEMFNKPKQFVQAAYKIGMQIPLEKINNRNSERR